MEKAQILVVEDEAIVAKHVQRALERVGYTVVGIAYTGEEAVRKAIEASPDLVLMDISLGGKMDGVEAAELIWEQSDVPVIYLTAYTDSETLERAKVTSPLGYIVKPFEERELHSTIEMALHRHALEKRLSESRRWLATTLDSIGDAVIAADTDCRITFVNRVAETLTGWTRDEAAGREFGDVAVILNERSRLPIENPIARTLDEGKVIKGMDGSVLVSRDGRETPVSDSASPIVDEKGRVSGVVLVLQDVTDRKEAESKIREQYIAIETQATELEAANAELRETQERLIEANEELSRSEEKFRTIFENANDEIMYLDESGRIIDVNSRIEDVFGWTRDEVVGRDFTEFLFAEGEVMQDLVDGFAAVAKTGSGGLRTFEGKRKDGSKVFVEASSRLVSREGGAKGVLIIARDVTERKRAEEQIIRRNRELAALNDIAQTISQSHALNEILNNALDKSLEILNVEIGGVHLMDGGRLRLAAHRGISDRAAEHFGTVEAGEGYLGMAAQSGEPLFVESLPETVRAVPDGIAGTVLGERLQSGVFVPLKARGEVLGVMCAFTKGARVFSPEDRDLLITIGHQVSTAVENAQLIEEASRARALEELDRLRTTLLASVSHELRTPLTSIKGISSSLVQPDIEWDADTRREFLGIVDREADILVHIVNDLMLMSQLEAGLMQMERRRSRVSTIVHQIEDQLARLVRGHQFEVDVDSDLAPVYADDVRIGQVMSNLVSNAVSYSDEGSTIRLSARQEGAEVVLSVNDEGIGIPSDHLGKVFDRFYRLESGVAHRRGGTGLGLPICRGIVEGHGGRIWVESEPGKGSTFSFSLPVFSDRAGRSDRQAELSSG